MATIKVKDSNPAGAIRELLGSMLEKHLVTAVLVPQEIGSGKSVVQTLVKDPAKLENVNPLAPVFAVNSARIVAQMCVDQMIQAPAGPGSMEPPQEEAEEAEAPAEEDAQASEEQPEQPAEQAEGDAEQQAPAEEQPAAQEQPAAAAEAPAEQIAEETKPAPIAVVLRPCEIRALIELVKLQQAILEPFLIIGIDCWGAYTVKDYAAKAGEGASITADFLKEVTAGNLPDTLCSACQICQYPEPTYADLAVRLIGEDINQQIGVDALTEKGKAIFEALGLEATPPNEKREKALEAIKEQKKKLAEQDEIDFLDAIASLCVNCKNCRAVCPICYCKQCVFDGDIFKYPLEKYVALSGKRGALNMPADRLLFHLTRMSHVATSCVACGRCESACPNGVPLGRIYHRISTAAQGELEYVAGRSPDEELPLTTFREDELSSVEN